MDKDKKSNLDSVPDNEKLCFDHAKSTSNVVEFEPNLLKHARIHFGMVADQLLKTKAIPASWTTAYVKSDPEDPGSGYTALEVAEITEESKESKQMIKTWLNTKPRFTSFLELSIHATGLTRIKSLKDAEFKTAVEEMDVLNVYRLMIELHTFIQGGAGFRDDDLTRREHSNFNRLTGESLVSYIQRYTKMKQKLITVGANDIADKKYMFRFLDGLRTYDKSSAVRNKVIEYLSLVEKNTFPVNLAAVQSELVDLDRVENVADVNSQPKGGNPFATVNMTNGQTPKIKMFADKVSVGYQEPDGCFRVFTANGLSKKLKYEPGKNPSNGDQPKYDKKKTDKDFKQTGGGGNSETPNTDRYVASQVKKTGKTKAAILKELRCNNCGEMHGVIAKDCKNPKKPDPVVNVTNADLKVGWNETVEVVDTPEHLKGYFSVLAIDANGIEPSYISPELLKKKKSRKKKKKIPPDEFPKYIGNELGMVEDDFPVVETPEYLKNLSSSVFMAHGMSKP